VASPLSYFKKQSSRTDLVSGQAQHGFKPLGFSGFCFGSVGSNGFSSGLGAGEPPFHQDVMLDNMAFNNPNLCTSESMEDLGRGNC